MRIHFLSRHWEIGQSATVAQHLHDYYVFQGREVSVSFIDSWLILPRDYKRLLEEIVEAQVDWVIVDGRSNHEFINYCRSAGLTGIVMWDPDEILDEVGVNVYKRLGGKIDLLIQEHKGLAERFGKYARLGSFWVPSCFERFMEPTKHEIVYDLGFLGYITNYRKKVLDRLFSRVSGKHIMWNAAKQGWKLGEDLGNFYSSCKIGIGLPREGDWKSDICTTSSRIFQVMGSGTMFLNSYTPGIDCLFIEGKHMDSWKTEEELFEKSKFYLENSKIREKIAEQGRKEIYKRHLAEYRAEMVWKRLEELLGK